LLALIQEDNSLPFQITYIDSSTILSAHFNIARLLLFFPAFAAAAAAVVALALDEALADLVVPLAFTVAVLDDAETAAAAVPAPLMFSTANVWMGEAFEVTVKPSKALTAFRPWTAVSVPAFWFAATATGRSTWFSAIWAVMAERDWDVVTVKCQHQTFNGDETVIVMVHE